MSHIGSAYRLTSKDVEQLVELLADSDSASTSRPSPAYMTPTDERLAQLQAVFLTKTTTTPAYGSPRAPSPEVTEK